MGGGGEGRRSLNPVWFAEYKFKLSMECENEVDELHEAFKKHMKRVDVIKGRLKVCLYYCCLA